MVGGGPRCRRCLPLLRNPPPAPPRTPVCRRRRRRRWRRLQCAGFVLGVAGLRWTPGVSVSQLGPGITQNGCWIWVWDPWEAGGVLLKWGGGTTKQEW